MYKNYGRPKSEFFNPCIERYLMSIEQNLSIMCWWLHINCFVLHVDEVELRCWAVLTPKSCVSGYLNIVDILFRLVLPNRTVLHFKSLFSYLVLQTSLIQLVDMWQKWGISILVWFWKQITYYLFNLECDVQSSLDMVLTRFPLSIYFLRPYWARMGALDRYAYQSCFKLDHSAVSDPVDG